MDESAIVDVLVMASIKHSKGTHLFLRGVHTIISFDPGACVTRIRDDTDDFEKAD